MRARFHFIETEAQQGLLGIREIEKIDLAGKIAGSRDFELLPLLGKKFLLEELEVAGGFAVQKCFCGKLDGEVNLLS